MSANQKQGNNYCIYANEICWGLGCKASVLNIEHCHSKVYEIDFFKIQIPIYYSIGYKAFDVVKSAMHLNYSLNLVGL